MRKYGKAMIPWNWASLILRTNAHLFFPQESEETRHLVPPSPSSKGQLGFESKSQAVVAVVRIGRSNSAGELEATSSMPTEMFWELPKEIGY